jgi:hypothetical protein
MDWLLILQQAGLPVVSAYETTEDGVTQVDATFSRALLSDEWLNYLKITNLPEYRRKISRFTARAIPSWALWTQAEADAWATTNIATPLASARTSLPATLTLATARAAFVVLLNILDKMWILQKANAQMTLALRDAQFPDLPERTTIK